ncbi:MAG TPA: acyltransferase domain-containing protein, partial [Candidatus Ozemobacteraceae bacterium]|nr:acyltransferase domain-containing protein [Candidatus Ozemobacteraceae bacterium]
NRLNFGGTNCVVDAACASSLSALNLAVLELASRRCDLVVTGGVDTFNDIFMYMCFSKTPALSPTGHARPFSADCDGTTLGEGIGMVVLKRLADAQAAGDRVYAIIKGVGTSSDGKGKAIYAPSSQGQMKALRRAYEQAGVTPQQIGLLEAHGTGTKVGDQIEISALREVYPSPENQRPYCGIGSVKSMIGHTKAAAGVAGLIRVSLALYHKVMPPTLKISKPAPGVMDNDSPFFLLGERHPWFINGYQPRRAAVSSFGFRGSNYHAVLEEGNSRKLTRDWDSTHEMFAFSGDTPATVREMLGAISGLKNADEIRTQAALSRRRFQATQACRLALLVELGKTDLAKLVQSVTAKLGEAGVKHFSLTEGAWYGTGPVNGKMAWLFPGQGAQYPHMGRDLAILSPEMFTSIAEASALLGEIEPQNRTLTDCLYPPHWFSPEAAKADEDRLKTTQVAQPAIGAVSLGMAALLQSWGLRPEGAVGHSFGELTALCVAGAFNAESLIRMSRKRGELMGQGTGDRGGMLAVSAPAAEVAQVLKQAGLDLTLANHNAPDQIVISGRKGLLEKARELCQARKWRSTLLQVAAAFHSPLVADAAVPFREALENVSWNAVQIPVYANTTAEPYPTDQQQAKDLLGSQLARPVRFVDSIERMYADGYRVFVEVGPGGRLSGLARSILGDRPVTILTLDASSGRKPGTGDLGRVLAPLAALGYPVQINGWEDGELWLEKCQNEKHSGLSVKLNGANYRTPRP